MSTIVIIGGGSGGTNPNRVSGSSVVDANGMTVATFNTPEQAIRYLRSISALSRLESDDEVAGG